jgi:2-keto-4-pentenoate hydratase/2-oxohepta-3-ene-1,7-dioic acid hydratase in catechol pathway
LCGPRVADLRAAYERLLVEEDRLSVQEAGEAARAEIPDAMIDLIRRGEAGVACVRRAAAFLEGMDEGALDAARSPSGDRIAYGSGEATLRKPLEAYRTLNIGANYDAYLAMMKFVEPYPGTAEAFWKLPQCLIGPEEGILWPASSKQITCEMELGVIVGKEGKRIPQAQALDHVYGYTVVNDVTAIDLFKRGLGEGREGLPGFYYLSIAKSMDTFEPIGPCITLREAVPDPQGLAGEFRVNGEMRVRGHTSDMRLGVAALIEYLSQDITLYPGDLIATGAMATAAYAPQVQVRVGDTVEMEFERIGVLRNHVVD